MNKKKTMAHPLFSVNLRQLLQRPLLALAAAGAAAAAAPSLQPLRCAGTTDGRAPGAGNAPVFDDDALRAVAVRRAVAERQRLDRQQVDSTIFAVLGVGGVAVSVMLLLALRASRRTKRSQDFLQAVERAVNAHPAVRRSIGSVYAAGAYAVQVEPTRGGGSFRVSSPGPVRGAVEVEASRDADTSPWVFRTLVLEMDKAALDERNRLRGEVAARAGYAFAADAAPNGAPAGAAAATPGGAASSAASEALGVSVVKDEEGKEQMRFKLF